MDGASEIFSKILDKIERPLIHLFIFVVSVTFSVISSEHRAYSVSLAAGSGFILICLAIRKVYRLWQSAKPDYQSSSWQHPYDFTVIGVDEFAFEGLTWKIYQHMNCPYTAYSAECPKCAVETLVAVDYTKNKTKITCPNCHKESKLNGTVSSLLQRVTHLYQNRNSVTL